MASYPTSVFSPTTKTAGQTIQPAHINDAQAEITALETDLLTWTSYTPTWGNTGTANTLGNGDLQGKWKRVGDQITVYVALTWGTTTASGSGAWTFLLPVTGAGLIAAVDAVGAGLLTDASAGQYGCTVGLLTTTTCAPFPTNVVNNGVSSTVPFVWTNPDRVSFTIVYEAA